MTQETSAFFGNMMISPVILFGIGICVGYCGIDCGVEQE